jgi:hypothetical protein
MTVRPESVPGELNPGTSGVALLGAYERDNFGDVLFLQLTQDFLSPMRTVATAPLGSHDNFRPLGRDVVALRAVLPERPQAIWMVGGEAGGTSMEAAFRMAASDSDLERYQLLSARERARYLVDVSGRSHNSSPYLPRMSAHPDTFETRFIVNSAGLSGLGGLIGHRADEAWGAVGEAAFVSVRDRNSSAVLREAGVDHILAPDFVHSVRKTRADWISAPPESASYVLVHVKASTLRGVGTERFADILLASRALTAFDLRFFVAGSARGHDSVALYEEVISAIRRKAPGRPVSIAPEESPEKKAELIARSALWIGTSLHGLIISSAFDIPRVGLELPKLLRYAETWADPMPVGVDAKELADAIDLALRTRETSGRADSLADKALASARQAADALSQPMTGGLARTRSENARRQARRSKSPIRTALTVGAETLRAWRHS